jgi:hypothetical protein
MISHRTTISASSGSGELRAAVAAALDRGVAIGAGGSRLLRGNDPEHEALEAEAAAFFGSESALFFSSRIRRQQRDASRPCPPVAT